MFNDSHPRSAGSQALRLGSLLLLLLIATASLAEPPAVTPQPSVVPPAAELEPSAAPTEAPRTERVPYWWLIIAAILLYIVGMIGALRITGKGLKWPPRLSGKRNADQGRKGTEKGGTDEH